MITPEHFAAQQTQFLKGTNWRVGYQPDRDPFPAIVGSQMWAIELTAVEWHDFCQGLDQILLNLATIRPHLMAEEHISLEHKTDRIILVATGQPDQFSLYLQIISGRSAEGIWSAEAVPELIEATHKLSLRI